LILVSLLYFIVFDCSNIYLNDGFEGGETVFFPGNRNTLWSSHVREGIKENRVNPVRILTSPSIFTFLRPSPITSLFFVTYIFIPIETWKCTGIQTHWNKQSFA
jgi:hypothetical protein